MVDQLAAMSGRVASSVIHGSRGRIAAYCEAAGIPHWQVAIDRQARLPFGFFQLVGAIRKASPDLAIIYGQWAGLIGPAALRMAGVRRSIYGCHWPSFYTDWDIRRVVRNRICESIPCRWCDRVVTLSRGSWYQYSIRKLGAGKLRIIHNCVDSRRVPSLERIREVRAAEGWDDGHCHIVSAGRLADQKCLDWLLRSWRIVQAKAANARLWIIGSGPEEAALRRLAKELQIGETCTFLGNRPNGIEYLAAADIVAITSLYEGHSIVSLEALACGRPLVASKVDGLEDSLDDGVEGFLAWPGEIEQFAEKLLLLIEDAGLRKKMGEAGRVRAREFSVERVCEQYLLLIEEVLAESK